MTDQPTKEPLRRIDFDTVVHVWSGDSLTIFDGPDREANAALFIRAQHMDELVEALDGMLTWAEKRPDKHPHDTRKRARTILAKIKGEK